MAIPGSNGFVTPTEARAGGTTPPKHRGPASGPRNKSKKSGGGASGRTITRVKGALNPRFDPRMRQVGSPLNRGAQMKRGWIQTAPKKNGGGGDSWEDADNRVNFLFNPPSVTVNSSLAENFSRSPLQVVKYDPGDQWRVGAASEMSVNLLYDRSYEMFNPYRGGRRNLANQYGVYADVAAWYYYLHMIDEVPRAPLLSKVNQKTGVRVFNYNWAESIISRPMLMVPSHLFVGPSLVYYGYVTSLEVVYSHFSQRMIPVRCAVNIGFKILPDQSTSGGGGGKKNSGGVPKNATNAVRVGTSGPSSISWGQQNPLASAGPVGYVDPLTGVTVR